MRPISSMRLAPMPPYIRPLAAWLTLAACLAWAAPALGHALAQRTDPVRGATLERAPAHVSIYFDARLEPLFSKLTVRNAQGRKVSAGDGKVESGDGKVLTARVSGVGKGTYRVEWDVVSRDGHRSTGSYTFTVR